MLKRLTLPIVLIILTSGISPTGATEPSPLRLFDVEQKKSLSLAEAAQALAKSRIILVGEHHSSESNHLAQLAVIRALHRLELPLAIGLEMFRADSQPVLDAWVAGSISTADFLPRYYDNWNFDWSLYRRIFVYARQHRIPMVGLNVAPGITRQVARSGFTSLSQKQRGQLPEITCRVDQNYMDYIRRAFGAHAHGNLDFTNFCEAQLVWDTVMAIHALDYLADHPQTVMVILTGSGHAHKRGIPWQIHARSPVPVAVILPDSGTGISIRTTGPEDTDYIFENLAKLVPASE